MIDIKPMDYVASSILNATLSLPPEAAIRVIESAVRVSETPEQFDAAVEVGVRLEETALVAQVKKGVRDMVSPFKFRPSDPEDEDWTDNRVSNFMAWSSQMFLKNWCHKEGHWTGKLSNYLWTLCPCCLLLRGFFVGVLITSIIATLI